MAKKKKKMPKCECGSIWLWDWELDWFVNEEGNGYKEYNYASSKDGMDFTAVTQICKCGRINSILVGQDSIGVEPIHPLDHHFNDVDWEVEGSYERS